VIATDRLWGWIFSSRIRPLPGRHVTDHQMRLYMKFRPTESPSVAAAKASISTATAYRFEHDHRLPSDHQQIRGRRRPDPLADFFETEIVPMLKAAPELRAVAIFEEMQRRHPALAAGVRRTLERQQMRPIGQHALVQFAARFANRGRRHDPVEPTVEIIEILL
jgi:hypothetical protein